MLFVYFVSAIHPEFPSPLPAHSTFTFASDLKKKGKVDLRKALCTLSGTVWEHTGGLRDSARQQV